MYTSPGPAGSGKTSLLRRLEARLGGETVFINVARAESFTGLMAQLASAIRSGDLERDPEHRPLDGHVSDALVALRAAALEHRGAANPVVLLDGLTKTLRHELFGRQRDELWEIPVSWVVTGRTALVPPADTYFESTVVLDPLPSSSNA